ncbi:MAG: hypothetical protein JWM55_822 [Acidimicrobiaceae bacterium]|nr:hypothetical protein [Acidimicrobiaceae bacterium]
MSDAEDWHDLVVTLDDRGLDVLANAATLATGSLRPSSGPRSTISPDELHRLIAHFDICPHVGVGLSTALAEMGALVWANGVVPSDPACVAHLHPPALVASAVTELTVAATNQSMDSWDQSPAGTEIELHLMKWLAELIGISARGSGVMTSGGTASNTLALTLARSRMAARVNVDVLKSGLPREAENWRVVCSDQAHFSVQRACAQLGLGRDAVVAVATTATGSMEVTALDHELERLSQAQQQLLAIVATAGTTDLGAIDPLAPIAERARRHDAWFHVDAAVAGAYLLSEHLAKELAGIEFADSVTVDFHKLWWQPFNASALVVRDAKSFDILRVTSAYLDRGDEVEGMENLVARSLDTSRRFDAAKVVASLRAVGKNQLGKMLEHLVALARYAGTVIESQTRLQLVAPPMSVMCVFDARDATGDDLRRVQQQLLMRGEAVLGRTVIKGRAALKFTFMNPLTTPDDVDRIIRLVVAQLDSL